MRPRVGQVVVLRDGSTATVVAVRRANDVLRAMSNDAAFVFGAEAAATYGANWRAVYYQADAERNGMLVTLTAKDVVDVRDAP